MMNLQGRRVSVFNKRGFKYQGVVEDESASFLIVRETNGIVQILSRDEIARVEVRPEPPENDPVARPEAWR